MIIYVTATCTVACSHSLGPAPSSGRPFKERVRRLRARCIPPLPPTLPDRRSPVLGYVYSGPEIEAGASIGAIEYFLFTTVVRFRSFQPLERREEESKRCNREHR